MIKGIFKDRTFLIAFYALFYIACWEIVNFETAVIIGISTILAHLTSETTKL